jgi:uncharacterized protein (DUF2267 family)
MTDHARIVGRSVQDFQEWIKAIDHAMGLNDEQKAYAIMRGVLHQLRDRMPIDEAAHLGAQLPTLVRGVYYEQFSPAHMPEKERHVGTFLERVAERMQRDDVDPEKATRTVFAVIKERIDVGELRHVVHMMPDEIKGLWNDELAV